MTSVVVSAVTNTVTVTEGDGSTVVTVPVTSTVTATTAGPQGPIGPTGVVAATAPISYDSGTQTVSTSMATNRLLGRTTAGTGVAEEISIGTGLSLSAGTLSNTAITPPGGSNTQIQFNDSGSFGGDADLTFNKTTNALTVGGDVTLNDGGSFTTTLQTITPTANRTISLPDATGTVGLVAGSSGQLTWNSSGAYAGLSTSSVDGSGNVTLSARYIGSVNGASAAPPLSLTGTWFTGGGTTNTKPQLLVEPAGTTSTAWSNSGTGLGVNAASGFVGRLLDLQLNGTSNFSVSSAGATTAAGASTAQRFIPTDSAAPTNGMYLPANNEVGFATNSTYRGRFDASGRLLVGATAARANLDNTTNSAAFQLEGADDTGRRAVIVSSVAASSGARLDLVHQRSGAIGGNTILQAEDTQGVVGFGGSDGAQFVTGAFISCIVDGAPGVDDMPSRLSFQVTADNASVPTEALRITNDRVFAYNQAAPATADTAVTLTIANLKTGIVTSAPAAPITLTLPTGTNTEGGFSGIYTNLAFQWSLINTSATNAITLAGNTGHTIVGNTNIAANESARFASRRTAANTFVTYRLS